MGSQTKFGFLRLRSGVSPIRVSSESVTRSSYEMVLSRRRYVGYVLDCDEELRDETTQKHVRPRRVVTEAVPFAVRYPFAPGSP